MMETENMQENLTNLPVIPNLIIIGGSSRNVGKTSLALELITKYASNSIHYRTQGYKHKARRGIISWKS